VIVSRETFTTTPGRKERELSLERRKKTRLQEGIEESRETEMEGVEREEAEAR
jgi:hypothetical protein